MSAPHTALGTAIAELAEHALQNCTELRTSVLDFADELDATDGAGLTNAEIAGRLRNLVGEQW
ncbi:hypothetical protein [Nocardia niigatensis]|uniref:hypothetical protein n=1 Tax=Nocardia niigatensis TaxID=209249 RepID=UPI0002D8EA2E|nr:hypothetical protein [Nocardia niigatensis]